LVRANDRCVDHHPVFIDLELQRLEDRCPEAAMRPLGEPVVRSLPRSKPLRQVSPRNARLGAVQHRVDEQPVPSFRSWSAARGQRGADQLPLLVGQGVSVHHDPL
jgi:hypothetical protein